MAKFFSLIVLLLLAITGCTSDSTSTATTSTTTTTVAPPLLISPLYNSTEATRIGGVFRWPAEEAEHGYHSGIDVVFVASQGGYVRAAVSGEVTDITTASSHADPTIDIIITYQNIYNVLNCFEPLAERYVEKGDQVQAGQLIGKVGSWEIGDYGPVLHFEVDVSSSPECPMQYFDQAARAEFRTIYNVQTREGFVDPCYLHPQGCPSVHF